MELWTFLKVEPARILRRMLSEIQAFVQTHGACGEVVGECHTDGRRATCFGSLDIGLVLPLRRKESVRGRKTTTALWTRTGLSQAQSWVMGG